MDKQEAALIVGVGPGVSASLARLCVQAGMRVMLAARDISKLDALVMETGAIAISCDATDPVAVGHLFDELDGRFGRLDLVLYNASGRYREKIEAIVKAQDKPSRKGCFVLRWFFALMIASIVRPGSRKAHSLAAR